MAYNPGSVFEAIRVYVAEAPTYHVVIEVLLGLWIVYLLFFSKQYRPKSKHDKLTKEEEEELIAEWQPEPLVPSGYPNDREVDLSPVVSSSLGPHVIVNGKECLNLATFNFLGFLGNQEVKESAANSIKKYGVGSCGPRGFYGTVDIHLELEERLAKFTGREEAIIYSYGFATISSAIPAYSKRRDVIFCDDGVCFAIQKGLSASRSKIKYFRHNDMNHLEQLLEEQMKLDKKNPAKEKVTRKFIVAEALYMNHGDLCPLPKLVEFRNKYRTPIFLEESLSFGVLGEHGRGATEHWGLAPDDVDLICASLETAVASTGGFCAGKSYVVDHQRLSGLGYCFSAAMPPMLAAASIKSLDLMEASPDMFSRLRAKAVKMRQLLQGASGLCVCGESFNPTIHLQLTQPSSSRETDDQLLERVADECRSNGVAVVVAKYLNDELKLPPASIRITVCIELTDEELEKAAEVIKAAATKHIT